MDCCVCKKAMVILDLDGVEVDHCFSCGGIWLDQGELDLLLKDPKKTSSLLDSVKTLEPHHEEKRKCPICRSTMKTKKIEDKKPLRIDLCLKNHGLWFDRGELEEILNQANTPESLRVAAHLKEIFKFHFTTTK